MQICQPLFDFAMYFSCFKPYIKENSCQNAHIKAMIANNLKTILLSSINIAPEIVNIPINTQGIARRLSSIGCNREGKRSLYFILNSSQTKCAFSFLIAKYIQSIIYVIPIPKKKNAKKYFLKFLIVIANIPTKLYSPYS